MGWEQDRLVSTFGYWMAHEWARDLQFSRSKFPLARGEIRIMVDLDEENNRPMDRRSDDRKIYCNIKQSAVIRMAALHAYLNKQMDFDNTVLCAISKCLSLHHRSTSLILV